MKKRLLSLALTISLMLLSVTAFAVPVTAETETIFRILHTNDIHGYYTETGRGQVGFAALKTIIDDTEPSLVLDAGDTFHGQAFATVEQGLAIAELMDAVGYDATTPGNHDWSYGSGRLKELGVNTTFQILGANVVETGTGVPFFDTPYLTKTITADDGTELRVGIFGVIDDAFYTSTVPVNVTGLTFMPEAEKANEIAETLRTDEGCDLVIALAHQTDLEGFVSNLSGVDVVIAGHEHKLIDAIYQDSDGAGVCVVEAGYYFQNIGVLTLAYDANTGRLDLENTKETFLAADNIPTEPDETVARLTTDIETRQAAVLGRVIGESRADYPYIWEEIRTAEQKIGRLITGAYLNATGADIAIENAGGIRAGLAAGEITYKDMISISPYGNMLVTCELTGAEVLQVLETSIDIGLQCEEVYEKQKEAIEAGEDPYQYAWPSNSGSYLQFGGISAKYDTSRVKGERVTEITIGGKALDLTKTYTVALNNYMLTSTDYPDIAAAGLKTEYSTCEEALIKFVGTGDFENGLDVPGIVRAEAETPTTTEPKGDSDVTAPETTAPTDVTGPPNTGNTPPDGITATSVSIAAVLGAVALLLRKKHV